MPLDIENIGKDLAPRERVKKAKWTDKEKAFLIEYAKNPFVGPAMREAGLEINSRTNKSYSEKQLIKRGYDLLDYPEAIVFVKSVQREIVEKGVFTLEKAVMETYRDYNEWREVNRREANIAYERMCKLLGLLDTKSVSVNTQIVTDENSSGITINFIQPGQENSGEK